MKYCERQQIIDLPSTQALPIYMQYMYVLNINLSLQVSVVLNCQTKVKDDHNVQSFV